MADDDVQRFERRLARAIVLGEKAGAIAAAVDWARSGPGPGQIAALRQRLLDEGRLVPGEEPGASVLALLGARALAQPGGRLEPEPAELAAAPAGEAGGDGAEDIRWFRLGLARARAVAALRRPGEEPAGAGVLVRGGELDPSLGDEPLLLVPLDLLGHWLGDSPGAADGTGRAEATFAGGGLHRVAEVPWTSSSAGVALARLVPAPEDIEPVPVSRAARGEGDEAQVSALAIALTADGRVAIERRAGLAGTGSASPAPPLPGAAVLDDGWALVALDLGPGRRDPRGPEVLLLRAADPPGAGAPAEAARAGHAPPDRPLPVHDDVQFSVWRPRVVAPGTWYPLLVFAHLERIPAGPDAGPDEMRPAAEVIEEEARRALGDLAAGYADDTESSAYAVPHEAEITFVPEVPGVQFNPPRATFLWLEEVHREEFRLRASPALDGKVARGRISVYWGRILLADMNVTLKVDRRLEPGAPVAVERAAGQRYHDIFASYSHRDTDVVQEFERYVRALGHRYLIDRETLRAGQVWDRRLEEMIRQADIFQLFWSRNAVASEFVEREWRYALALGREGFVRPVYWEDPLPELPDRGLPPPELKRLQFERFARGTALAATAEAKAAPGPGAAEEGQAAPPPPPTRRGGRRFATFGMIAAALLAVVVLVPRTFEQAVPPPESSEPVFAPAAPSEDADTDWTLALPPQPPPIPPISLPGEDAPMAPSTTIDAELAARIDHALAFGSAPGEAITDDAGRGIFVEGQPVSLTLDLEAAGLPPDAEVTSWLVGHGTEPEQLRGELMGEPGARRLRFTFETSARAPGRYLVWIVVNGAPVARRILEVLPAAEM